MSYIYIVAQLLVNPDAISGTQPAQVFVTTESLTVNTPLDGPANTNLILGMCMMVFISARNKHSPDHYGDLNHARAT